MHLSRCVLIALAVCASDAAARTQIHFNLGANTAPKEHSSSGSNPEPTASAVQSTSTSPSYGQWAGDIFRGWFGNSDSRISTHRDGQKTSITNKSQQIHASGPNPAGLPGVINGLESEFTSQTTVAKAISIFGHVASDAFAWEKERKPTGHPSNGQYANPQFGDGKQLPKAGGSAPSVTHAATSHSNDPGNNPARVTESKPPVPTEVVAALPDFLNGLKSELKDGKGRQSLSSEFRSIGNHVMSDVREWNQESNPTDAPRSGKKPPETGASQVHRTSYPDGHGADHQSVSPNTRHGEESKQSLEQPTRSRYLVSSFKAPGGTSISSRHLAEPSKASSKSPESMQTRESELGGSKSSDRQVPTQSAAQPHPTHGGQYPGQAEPSSKSPNGWLSSFYSRLQGNPPVASQKSPINVQGPAKSSEVSRQPGGLSGKSAPSNDHSQVAQLTRFGDFHSTASVSRDHAEPSSPPEPVPSSVESFLRPLPPGVASKSIEDILRGTPGLSIPSNVLNYLKKLPAEYKPLPLQSIYSHHSTSLSSLSARLGDGSLSNGVPGAQVPTNVRSFLDNLPTGKGSIPVTSILENHPEQLSGEVRSFLDGLPPALATVPIKSIMNGIPLPKGSRSVSKKIVGAPVPTNIRSFLAGLPSRTAALPIQSIWSKFPEQWPSDFKSFLQWLPSEVATMPFKSITKGFPLSAPSAVESRPSGSGLPVSPRAHGSVATLPTPLKPLESALESYPEHSRLPEPTGPHVSAVPFPDSIEPLQSTIGSYLSRAGIPFPTDSLESAIKHYFGPPPTRGAPLPSPSNAIEFVIASFVDGHSSRAVSTRSEPQSPGSKIYTHLPPVSSLHFGKPVSNLHSFSE
jgi:hypothetical protein